MVKVKEVNPDLYYPLTKSLKVDKKELIRQANELVNVKENCKQKKLII